jgi:eukaryotic-like serine/threonine-protein kinase
MNTDRFGRICELFEAARSLSKQACDEYLSHACDDDAELRKEVEDLLAEHTRQGPLDTNTPGELAELITSEDVASGVDTPTKIDRYTIIEHIGQGGMGSVYEARQQNPDRAVALKVIKRGMDSKQVIARFEAERQAVAMMDHPNIAQVFDAGTTEDGRPFFAMELVRGVSIIEYCQSQKLDLASRLDLFVQVCRAIQHAHQKGIIHRDIKPSNVLVTKIDGVAVPKIIDFGIAKATDSRLDTQATITMHGQLVGTPAYMSPEQTTLNSKDVDTRTDIYSLGVLLYELLTGTTPFTDEDLLSKGFAEMMRVINDDEPDKPSTRLLTLEKQGAAASLDHPTRHRTVVSMLQGDLDWIAMKCLEKDPDRRYESASALAQDIARFIGNEPVEARPPTRIYQIQKFVQRHRGQVIAGAAVLGVLLLGIAGTTGGMIWALDEQANAKQSAQDAENEARTAQATVEFLLSDLLGAADPARMEDRDLTVRQAVSIASESIEGKFTDQPEVEAQIRTTIAQTLEQLGVFDEAEPHHRRRLAIYESIEGESGIDTINAMHSLASNLMYQGRFDEAIEITIEEISILRAAREPGDDQLTNALSSLGVAYLQTGQYTKAAPILEETLQAKRRSLGDLDPSTLSSIHNLAGLYGQNGQSERALELAREAYRGRLEVLGPGDPRTFGSLNLVTWMLNRLERYDESKDILEDAIADAQSRLGPAHLQTTALIRTLATQHRKLGEYPQAERLLAPLLIILKDTLGDDNINTFSAMRSLADTIAIQGRQEESLALFAQALNAARNTLPPTSVDLTHFMNSYGSSLTQSQRFEEAQAVLTEAAAILEQAGPPGENLKAAINNSMIELYTAWNAQSPDADHQAVLEAMLETLKDDDQ